MMTPAQRAQCLKDFEFLKNVCANAQALTGPSKEAVAAKLVALRRTKR